MRKRRIHTVQDREKRVSDLKVRISIVDIIGSVVSLSKSGSILRGSCPFHADKDPSFTVYPSTNSFYCFGCRVGGDLLVFVQKFYDFDFPQAIDWLEDRVGRFEPIKMPAPSKQRSSIITPEIIEYYHSMLTDAHRQYFYSRLFADATVDREMWGWTGTRYSIPVWSQRPQESDVLGIRLRKASGEGPKYVGIRGSNEAVLYNTWTLEEEPGAFIFFGEFDAALAAQDRFPAVSPTNGCASWDSAWDSHFKGKEGIIIVPDRGEERFAHGLAEHLGLGRCRVLNLFDSSAKDYTEWRLAGHRPIELLEQLQKQYAFNKVTFDF